MLTVGGGGRQPELPSDGRKRVQYLGKGLGCANDELVALYTV